MRWYNYLKKLDIKENNLDSFNDEKHIFKLSEIHFIKCSKTDIYNKCKEAIKDYNFLDNNCNGFIKGWIEKVKDKYILNIASPEVIKLPINSKGIFSVLNKDFNLLELEAIELDNIDTSNVIDMSNMFDGLKNIKHLDLSNFDTKNVKNMSNMFYGLENIVELDLSMFDTSNVTDMSDLFACCYNIKSINLTSFNTKNVETMSEMFYECNMLEEISLNNFNCCNVKDFDLTFAYNNVIKKLSLCNLKINNPICTYGMFKNCKRLEVLDISGNDFSILSNENDVQYMDMFLGVYDNIKIYVGNEKEKITIQKMLININNENVIIK